MRRIGKKSIISGVLALSLILAGTGYAYWTDTLSVKAKATTGELDVTFADLGLYAQYGDEGPAGTWSIVDGIGESGYLPSDFFRRGTEYNKIAKDGSIDAYYERSKKYNNVEFNAELENAAPIKRQVGPYTSANTNGSDQIKLDIKNMYPGYAQAFRTDVLNVGTLAAKLSNIKFEVEADKAKKAQDMLGIALYTHQEQYSPDKSKDGQNVFKLAKSLGLKESQYFTVGGVDFVRLSALKSVDQEVIKKAIENAEILTSPSTDNRLDLFIGVAMDPDAEGVYTTGSTDKLNKNNDDADSENGEATVTVDFLWDQFNAGKKIEGTNILKEQNVGAKAEKPEKPGSSAGSSAGSSTGSSKGSSAGSSTGSSKGSSAGSSAGSSIGSSIGGRRRGR